MPEDQYIQSHHQICIIPIDGLTKVSFAPISINITIIKYLWDYRTLITIVRCAQKTYELSKSVPVIWQHGWAIDQTQEEIFLCVLKKVHEIDLQVLTRYRHLLRPHLRATIQIHMLECIFRNIEASMTSH